MRPLPIVWWTVATVAAISLSFVLNVLDLGLNSLTWTREATLNAIVAISWGMILVCAILFSKHTAQHEKKVFLAILLWLILYPLTAFTNKGVSLLLHVLGLVAVVTAFYISRVTGKMMSK